MVGRFGQAELCILMDIGEQTDPTGRSDYKVQKAFDGIEIGYDGAIEQSFTPNWV